MHDDADADPEPPVAHAPPEPELVVRVTIKRHIRDLDPAHEGGGSAAKILGDTEGNQWLVKAPNNPQGIRILANEYVAAALGARIGAFMQPGAVCMVYDEVASAMTLPTGVWLAGAAFGSALADGTKPYLDSMAPEIRDRDQLLGAIALDTWLSQHDSRQARVRDALGGGYDVIPVDFGHCIGPSNWADLAARPPIISVHDPNGWSTGVTAASVNAISDSIVGVTSGELQAIVSSIPDTWGVSEDERAGLIAFLVARRSGAIGALHAFAPAAP